MRMAHARWFKAATFFLTGVAALSAEPRDRLTRPIDPARFRPVSGSLHRLAQAQFDQGAVDPQTPITDVLIVFKMSPEQQADLDAVLAQQQNPSSPQYHKWLTPEEFGNRFGLSSSDHAKFAAWLTSEGFTVNELARGRNFIRFTGTAAQISRTFHTSIHRFQVDGEVYFANATDPAVPEALSGIVAGFIGLNDFFLQPAGNALPQATSTTGAHFLAPEDFATVYNLAPLYQAGIDGTGQSIAVVGLSQYLASDIQSFRKMFNLPVNDPKPILYGGTDPGLSSGTAQIEADLDLEWTGAIAPNATIYFIYGSNPFLAAVFAITNKVAPVLSMSVASCELNFDSPVYRPFFQQANAEGITALAASGDSGAASCDPHNSAPQATRGFA